MLKMNSKLISTRKLYFGFTVAHLCLIAFLGSSTSFAPDEKIYLQVFEKLYLLNFSLSEFHNGWQFSSLLFLRVIYGPALLLVTLGFDSLIAIRILSVFFSLLTLMLFCKIYSLNSKVEKKVPLFIAISMFIPSFFLWTSLGLRESIFFLLISLIFFASFEFELRNKSLYLILLIPFFCFLYLTKPHIYLILTISIIISFFIISLKDHQFSRKNILFVIISIVPLVLLYNSTLMQVEVIQRQIYIYKDSQNQTSINVPDQTSINVPEKSVTATEILLDRKENDLLVYRFLDSLSMFKTSKNNTEYSPASISSPYSLAKSSLNFILLPIPFRDNGSLFLNFISIEFFMWAFIYFKLISYFVSLKNNFHKLCFTHTILIIFMLIFVLFSALIEVNLGTSLRHRSLLLILILILLSSNYSTEAESHKSN
jgi:hypothetical protein